MTINRPVASVSGKRGWAWNRWQDERRSKASEPVDGALLLRRQPPSDSRQHPRLRDDPRDCRALERRLHQAEQHKQVVIGQYERILAEKNEELAERYAADAAPAGLSGALRAAVRRLVSR